MNEGGYCSARRMTGFHNSDFFLAFLLRKLLQFLTHKSSLAIFVTTNFPHHKFQDHLWKYDLKN